MRRTASRLILLSMVAALLLLAQPVSSQTDIPITDLGAMGSYGSPTDVNNQGQVVGYHTPAGSLSNIHFLWTPVNGWLDLPGDGLRYIYNNDLGQVVANKYNDDGQPETILWENGQPTPLGNLGGKAYAVPRALNELGQVIGDSYTAEAEAHAYLWAREGGMLDLGTLDGDRSRAVGMNDLGWVVGDSYTADGANHAFLWTPRDGMVDLGTLGGTYSRADAVNNTGQVVGTSYTSANDDHAFLWTAKGGMVDLGTLGGTYSGALDISESGHVVGWSYTSGDAEKHAFLWTSGGGMKDLGTLGGGKSWANRVNNLGHVVGNSRLATGETRAFYWTPTGGIVALGILPGGSRSDALDINERGQVVGWSNTADGTRHALLWTVASPEQQIQALGDQVMGLVDDGVLNSGSANALIQKLDNAARQLDAGKTNVVCAQMEAFINQVETLVRTGKLTEELGAELIGAANSIISLVCG
jgi:probable HAF family extracellular repeat protein